MNSFSLLFRFAVFSYWFAFSPLFPLAAAQAPAKLQLLRLVVVDISPSMDGDKLTLTRNTLIDIVTKDPPSPDRPVALITFGSTATPAKVFTDLPAARAFIDELAPRSSGTDIAAGLLQASADLQKLSAGKNTTVWLITDGEDPNHAGIRAAEAKLDALFTSRKKKGLSNEVYLKQWGGGGLSNLAKRLRTSQSATIMESDSLVLLPMKIRPHIKIHSAQRLSNQRLVELRWQAAITVAQPRTPPPPVTIKCTAQNATGETEAVVSFQRPSKIKRLVLRTDIDPTTSTRQHLISFRATLPPSVSTDPRPVLDPKDVTVPINLSPAKIVNRIMVTTTLTQPPHWIDPLTLRAAYPVTLKFKVTPGDATDNIDRSIRFRLVPRAGCLLLKGKKDFTLPDVGEYTLNLLVEAPAANPGVVRDKLRFALSFSVTAPSHANRYPVVPPKVDFNLDDLPPPAAVETPTAFAVQPLAPHWLKLPSLCIAYAQVKARVAGPVPPTTKLRVRGSNPIRSIDVRPAKLTKGDQILLLRIIAHLPPHPKSTALNLVFEPIHDHKTGVEFSPSHVKAPIIGPPPVQLIHANHLNQRVTKIAAQTERNNPTLPLVIQPGLLGRCNPKAASGIPITVECFHGKDLLTSSQVSINAASKIDLPFSKLNKNNAWWEYFFDKRHTVLLRLRPTQAAPSIESSTLNVEVVSESPFKRLLIRLSIILAAAGAIAVLVYGARKLFFSTLPPPLHKSKL